MMSLFASRTCFYVLGLIATTRQGADILKTLNWESVRHKGEDSWPVVEVKEEALPYSKWFVSSLSAATGWQLQIIDLCNNLGRYLVYLGLRLSF